MSNSKECFFIAPIDDEGSKVRERSDKVMEYIVEEAVSDYGYYVTRADQMDQPGSITNQVIQKTVSSELVIADLTGHNPNVFYELAVRHATGEPYIQLIKSTESIPFDISDLRTIKYGLDVDQADQAKSQIRSLLESLEEGEPEFDNPISESAEMQSLRKSADPTDKNLAEMLQTMYKLDNRMEELEGVIKNSDIHSNSENEQSVTLSDYGKYKSLSEEERLILQIAQKYESGSDEPVSRDQLVSAGKNQGMSEQEVENVISDLLMKGHVYEPDDRLVKTLN